MKSLTERFDFPPSVRELIAKYADRKISKILIMRKPLANYIRNFLNITTRGKVEKLLEEKQYQNLYHLFMIIILAEGTFLKLEKNEIIQLAVIDPLTSKSNIFKDENHITIDVSSLMRYSGIKELNFFTFMYKPVLEVGDRIFLYHPTTNNCQIYIQNIIRANFNPYQLEELFKKKLDLGPSRIRSNEVNRETYISREKYLSSKTQNYKLDLGNYLLDILYQPKINIDKTFFDKIISYVKQDVEKIIESDKLVELMYRITNIASSMNVLVEGKGYENILNYSTWKDVLSP